MAVIPRGSPALAAHQREVIDAIVVGRSFTPVFQRVRCRQRRL